MGEAREVMDRLTDAVMGGNAEAMREVYADDATLVTPDQGEITGADAIGEYHRQFSQAFPDAGWEPIAKHEVDNTAIDEGYFTGTHTAPLATPTRESIPATGKQIRVRECDVATVENGVITRHRFYYDQMELLGQLGLLPETLS